MTAPLPAVSTASPMRQPCRSFEWKGESPAKPFCKIFGHNVRIKRCATCCLYKPKAEGEK